MPSNSIFGFLNFALVRKDNDFAEFKVHLIHRKQGSLLHNTVLILCDEGLVAVNVAACHNKTQISLGIISVCSWQKLDVFAPKIRDF